MASQSHVASTSTTLNSHDELRVAIGARDDERARIARELHDGLGQQLAALRLMLAQHRAECQVRSRQAIDRVLNQATAIDAELDCVILELRPGTFDDAGLGASLRRLVEQWADCAAMETSCHCEVEAGRLSEEQQLTIYRVAQEALHNVQQHASATHVTVLSEIRGHTVVLVVQDDGVGFECKGLYSTSGWGFRGMHERATLAGGAVQVASSPGHGTTVLLQVPLMDFGH